MTSMFSWQDSISLCPASFVLQGQTCLLFGDLLTSYFFIQVPFDEKSIFGFFVCLLVCFYGVGSRKCYRSSQSHSASASLASVVGLQIWITVILNGLPWEQREIIMLFLRLHPSTTFWSLLLIMRANPFLLRDSCHSSTCNDNLN